MPVAAVPGHIRLRATQLGKETTFGTPVAATRRVPWALQTTIDPHWTKVAADTGTLDNALPPYRTGADFTAQATGPVAYDDIINAWAALLKGGIVATGAGAAKTWDFNPSATVSDQYELFTFEWGDEVSGDNMQFADGIVDKLVLHYPPDMGPIKMTADWRFASLAYPTTMTGALAVDGASVWAYAADTKVYIDSVAGSIGITPITDTLHEATLTVHHNTDVKRFANGSNARFKVNGYGRGERLVEVSMTFAKTAAALTEFANFLNAAPQERFVVLDTTSRDIITGSTPYSHKVKFAGHWYVRTEVALGGNSAASLVCRHMNDTALPSPFEVIVVNKKATLA